MMAAPPARGPSMSESASDIKLPSLLSHWAGRVKSTSAVASSVSRLVSAMVVTERPAAGAATASAAAKPCSKRDSVQARE